MPSFFNIPNYKILYNDSKINQNDEVVLYINKNLDDSTSILTFDKLKILQTKLKINDKNSITLAAIYRCHDLPESEFIYNIKNYLKLYKYIKNHLIIGDFNIDIRTNTQISQEHLNNFQENEFIPAITSITRPSINNPNEGSCIDNFFVKNKSLDFIPYKITNQFNDHYLLLMTFKEIVKLK